MCDGRKLIVKTLLTTPDYSVIHANITCARCATTNQASSLVQDIYSPQPLEFMTHVGLYITEIRVSARRPLIIDYPMFFHNTTCVRKTSLYLQVTNTNLKSQHGQ